MAEDWRNGDNHISKCKHCEDASVNALCMTSTTEPAHEEHYYVTSSRKKKKSGILLFLLSTRL